MRELQPRRNSNQGEALVGLLVQVHLLDTPRDEHIDPQRCGVLLQDLDGFSKG